MRCTIDGVKELGPGEYLIKNLSTTKVVCLLSVNNEELGFISSLELKKVSVRDKINLVSLKGKATIEIMRLKGSHDIEIIDKEINLLSCLVEENKALKKEIEALKK